MDSAAALAERLTDASRRKLWDVHSAFQWPESLPAGEWMMTPELLSMYGTPAFEALSEEQRRVLSLFEIGNFFSLVLQGERPLVQGLVHRMYGKHTAPSVTDYLHHFVDEENKHMVMFGIFCQRYLGKVYPEKKVSAGTGKLGRGEEEVVFYCKVLVVEELGDYYNVVMQKDPNLVPIVRELNRVHHIDESRHLAFGRQHLRDLVARHKPEWSPEALAGVRTWFLEYLQSSWADYYNPAMYRDAGLADSYELHRQMMASPICALHRRRASKKLTDLALELGLIEEEPDLRWTS